MYHPLEVSNGGKHSNFIAKMSLSTKVSFSKIVIQLWWCVQNHQVEFRHNYWVNAWLRLQRCIHNHKKPLHWHLLLFDNKTWLIIKEKFYQANLFTIIMNTYSSNPDSTTYGKQSNLRSLSRILTVAIEGSTITRSRTIPIKVGSRISLTFSSSTSSGTASSNIVTSMICECCSSSKLSATFAICW